MNRPSTPGMSSTLSLRHLYAACRIAVQPLTAILLTAFFIATAGNFALWRSLLRLPELAGWHGLLFGAAFLVAVLALNTALLSLFAWRGLLRLVLIVLVLVTAIGSGFMLSYDVVIDRAMLVSALLTDRREVGEVIGWIPVAVFLALGVVPALLIGRMELRWPSAARQLRANALLLAASLTVAAVAGIAFFPAFSSSMRNHKEMRYRINPFNSLYALARLGEQPIPRAGAATLPMGLDAHLGARASGSKPPLVVMVVGETARADHFGINGYARDTTPELAREGVVSLRNVWSCDTYSAGSIPCMFSPLGREAFRKQKAHAEGLADVLQRAGYAVLWVDNQPGGCKGVCDRVPTVADAQLQVPGVCTGTEECPDEVMLQGLDERIARLPRERQAAGIVVFLHQMGSHGPDYHKRSAAGSKRFLPECTTSALQQCSEAEVVNAYDNTIVHTDRFLALAIDWLKRHEGEWATALTYVSDHGESLGEGNLYLHGLPYAIAPDAQKHVPWVFWLSPQFQRERGVSAACLARERDQRLSHDNYFHTTIGLLGVVTSLYDPARDIAAACTGPVARADAQ